MDDAALARFTALYQVDLGTGCWLWLRPDKRHGRATFWLDGRKQKAPRVAYEHYRGPLGNQQAGHTCEYRHCVNPWHVEPMSNIENQRMRVYPPTCPKGHPFNEENTLVRDRNINRPRRACKACRKVYMAEYHRRTRH